MRHAAVTFAEMVNQRTARGESWDVLFATDMLNLAEFKGLVNAAVHRLPSVVYFHENQLTYPVRHKDERDLHFAFTNLTTALAADAVWFNSAYHRETFIEALMGWLRRMPDHQPLEAVDRIRERSAVQWPGTETFLPRPPRAASPLRILWTARWEYDKNPETFFDAVARLKCQGVPFRLSVIGPQYREIPPIFDESAQRFAQEIDRWGYQADRTQYEASLTEADVVVSTAVHEFFGISMVEAIAAGAYPLLPRRLAYPELLTPLGTAAAEYFYDGTAEMLAERLASLAKVVEYAVDGDRAADRVQAVGRYAWSRRAAKMDAALESL